MRTRTIFLVGVVLMASVVGLLVTSLSKAASHPPAADECQLFSCIFDDVSDGD